MGRFQYSNGRLQTENGRALLQLPDTVDESAYLNLASAVPQEARDLWAAKPDIRSAYTTQTVDASYENRGADLSVAIENASSNGDILDLGSGGEYEMSSTVSGSNIVGVVGDADNRPRIYYQGTSLSYLFNISFISDLVLEGVVFDITEGADTDVGVLTSNNISNEVWAEDIRLEGQRHRTQDGTTVGGRFTFLVQVDAGATAFLHRCEFPDGGTAGVDGNDAIGPNSDPSHEGLNVWKECTAEGFHDNGFYIAHNNGTNILWDCYAANNRAGNFRLGTYDTWENRDIAVGCTSEHTADGDALGQCFTQDHPHAEFRGCTAIVNNTSWGDSVLQIRSGDGGSNEAERTRFDRVVVHVKDGTQNPIRTNTPSTVDVEITDVYWYDEIGSGSVFYELGRGSTHATADVEEGDPEFFRAEAAGNLEVDIGDSSSLTIGSNTYTTGTYSSADLNLGDPLEDFNGLPQFYFEYESKAGPGA